MNLWLWKEELVRDEADARRRAEYGFALLDKKRGPGWDREIDIDHVHIASPINCVLGQIAQKHGVIWLSPARCVDGGFACGILLDLLIVFLRVTFLSRLLSRTKVVRSYELLTDAWKAVLRERREPATSTWAQQAAARLLRSTTTETNRQNSAAEPALV